MCRQLCQRTSTFLVCILLLFWNGYHILVISPIITISCQWSTHIPNWQRFESFIDSFPVESRNGSFDCWIDLIIVIVWSFRMIKFQVSLAISHCTTKTKAMNLLCSVGHFLTVCGSWKREQISWLLYDFRSYWIFLNYFI